VADETRDPGLSKLLAEYQAAIQLWQHDDNLRQARQANFLNANVILAAVLGAVLSVKSDLAWVPLLSTVTSAFGLPLCIVWYRVQRRSSEYIRFRRFHLRDLEARIGGLSLITSQSTALSDHAPVAFSASGETFSPDPSTRSSTSTEARVPLFLAGFWVLVLVAGASFAVYMVGR